MAPNKIEDHIREKLEERALQPSEQAWQKLEGMLGEQEKKLRPSMLWYTIAASIIGVLLTSTFFFNDTKVSDEIIANETPNSTEFIKDDIHTNEILEKEQIAVENITKNTVNETTEKVENRNQNRKVINNTQKEPIALTNSVHNNRLSKEEKKQLKQKQKQKIIIGNKPILEDIAIRTAGEETMTIQDKILQQNVDKVVAEVIQLKRQNTTVNQSEVEALLTEAQEEIALQRILNETEVDAMALLDDVEFELEHTFRDKVYYALGEGFEYIKTRVANRNN